MTGSTEWKGGERLVKVPAGAVTLEGSLDLPGFARGVVLFVNGSGNTRHCARNRYVARMLRAAGLATLLIDLLSPPEMAIDRYTSHLRFDIGLLADRLVLVSDWLADNQDTRALMIGLFATGSGAAAALVAAAERPHRTGAIVARAGRPDLAGDALAHVKAPTLLMVGSNNRAGLEVNRQAMATLRAETELHLLPDASQYLDEPGTLEEVARLARNWFESHLTSGSTRHVAGF